MKISRNTEGEVELNQTNYVVAVVKMLVSPISQERLREFNLKFTG